MYETMVQIFWEGRSNPRINNYHALDGEPKNYILIDDTKMRDLFILYIF